LIKSHGRSLVLALLRIYAGLFWLSHGIPKFTGSDKYMPPSGFMPQFVLQAVQGSTGFYHDFLVGVVTPHIALFAELVRLGEVLAGCSLLFGLLTRVGGLAGAFLALNYFLAKGGFTSWEAIGSPEAAAIALSLVNVLLPTGRYLGVDALFGGRRKDVVIVPEVVDERKPVTQADVGGIPPGVV
jgi:uncharacterized membrane protein YphA (DoxX/SURF4 family)